MKANYGYSEAKATGEKRVDWRESKGNIYYTARDRKNKGVERARGVEKTRVAEREIKRWKIRKGGKR